MFDRCFKYASESLKNYAHSQIIYSLAELTFSGGKFTGKQSRRSSPATLSKNTFFVGVSKDFS